VSGVENGPDTGMGVVMRALVGDCPKRDAAQIQDRCDPFCPTLAELFFRPSAGLIRRGFLHAAYKLLP
jgi:hypothetical protein